MFEDDYDEARPQDVNVPHATPVGLAIYKSLLDDYGPKTVPAFDPALLTRSILQFHAGQGLMEIGMIQQLKQQGASPKTSSRREVTPSSSRDWDELGLVVSGGIFTGAGIAIGWGIKGGAFQTRSIWGGLGNRSPLWSVTKGVRQLLANGYVPNGSEVVRDNESQVDAAEGDFGVGSAFAFGITGYI